ncbi:hypothetical protein ES702_07736 [subsurface metagenome]
MRLNVKAFALTFGIIWGLGLKIRALIMDYLEKKSNHWGKAQVSRNVECFLRKFNLAFIIDNSFCNSFSFRV